MSIYATGYFLVKHSHVYNKLKYTVFLEILPFSIHVDSVDLRDADLGFTRTTVLFCHRYL